MTALRDKKIFVRTGRIVWLVMSFLWASFAIQAQDAGALIQAQAHKALGQSVEASLKSKDKKRKLTESIAGSGSYEQRWSVNGKEVNVWFSEFASAQEAAQNLELAHRGVQYAELFERLNGYGDGGTLVGDSRGKSTWLNFTSGKRYIAIHANLTLAKEFARDISDYLAHNSVP